MVDRRTSNAPYSAGVTTQSDPNSSSPSATWAYRRVKITPPPQRPRKNDAEGVLPALPRWNPREPLSLQVTYRGGAEAWWEIRARGRVWRRPGWQALDDVLAEVFAGTGGKAPAARAAGGRRGSRRGAR